MTAELIPEARELIESGRLAHFTTVAKDGRPHTTVVWVGLDGDALVIGKLMPDQKVANLVRDPRVSISMEAEGTEFGALTHYLVIEGDARVTEGGARELLHDLAQTYVGPGTQFPPPGSPDGFVIRVTPTKVRGTGPWGTHG